MNDSFHAAPVAVSGPAPSSRDPALPPGSRLDAFEIQRVIGRSAHSTVYLATDHALGTTVAIQEYLPARLVQRDARQHLQAVDPSHEAQIARGLCAFIDEARMLAHCDHPALVRVLQLREANATAYRVMPFYTGQRLIELRRHMVSAPDEASLRALLDGLLGALETIHRSGHVHGGVTAANILLLTDDRPLLLGPGAAGREVGSDLVESLMASLASSFGASPDAAGAGSPPGGVAGDLCALAEVMRFCITGEMPRTPGVLRSREPLAAAIATAFGPAAQPHYSAAFLSALGAAASPFAADRPLSAAQFRDWLDVGAPSGRPDAAAAAAAAAATETETTIATETDPSASFSGDAAVAPMTTDRAPWGPTVKGPRAPRAAPRRRWRQALLGGTLALLGAGAVAIATGAWDLAPSFRLDRHAEVAAAVTPATPPDPPPEAQQPTSAGLPEAPPPVATPAAPSAGPGPALIAEPVRPAMPAASVAAPVTPTQLARVDPPSPTAAPAALASSQAPQRQARAARPLATPAAAGEPRAACVAKTEFARYRCMQVQCQSARWAAHPQCVRLRTTDQVD